MRMQTLANAFLTTLCYEHGICHYCYRDPSPTRDVPTSYINSTVCEARVLCIKCDHEIDYYAYGNYMSMADVGQFSVQQPELYWTLTHLRFIFSEFRNFLHIFA